MKISQALVASTLALLFAGGANALQITTEAGGVTTSSVTGVAVETFNNTADFIDGSDTTCGLYSSCSGDFTVYNTPSGIGQSAPPAGISSYYLSVPNPDRTGTATFSLGTTANYFGLYWGSIDSYNTLSFLLGTDTVASFTGTQIAAYIPGLANGDQESYLSNRYFNFFFGSQLFDTVVLDSQGYAFETDNHAFATVPEPATLALLALGLTGLILARRRKKA